MYKRPVSIIDYGSGNLLSVSRAAGFCGAQAQIVTCPSEIGSDDIILIPGVAAFPHAMDNLNKTGFVKAIQQTVKHGGSVLGICVGMQILFENSLEFVQSDGLGILDGVVNELPGQDLNGVSVSRPNIGWRRLYQLNENLCNEESSFKIFSQTDDKVPYIYLSHSFHVLPADMSIARAFIEFGGHKIVAAVQKENVIGLQFHPEKSGEYGLHVFDQCLASLSC